MRIAHNFLSLLFFSSYLFHCSSEAYILDMTNLSITTAPEESENLATRLWISIPVPSDSNDHQGMNQVQELGSAGIRIDLPWQGIENTKGQYNFSQYDNIVRDIKSRKLKAIFILDYGNTLYFPAERAPNQDAEYQAFAHFAAAAAKRYAGQGIFFEIWNEPNSKQFWPPEPNADNYGKLVRQTIDAIHQVKPEAKIILGGTAKVDIPFIISSLKAAGGTQGISALSVHPYYDPPEVLPLKINTAKQQLSKAGIHLPLWDGESGYSSGNYRGQYDAHSPAARRRQGIYVVRKYLNIWSAGIPISVLYNLHDSKNDANDTESNFGLLDYKYGPNPAFTMLKTLTSIASNHTLQGKINDLPEGVYGLLLSGNNEQVISLWQAKMNKSSSIEFSIDKKITIRDVWGQEKQNQWCKTIDQVNKCTIPLAESIGPVYISVVMGKIQG